VGTAGDLPAAVADAVAQWTLGVLPVLAHWRGKHSCFATSGPLDTQGGQFELLAGPVISRGQSEAESNPGGVGEYLTQSLSPVLGNERLAQRLHWLELFTCKVEGATADATCRLDNRDWLPGKNVLVDVAAAWPAAQEPLQSARQFAMLLPRNGDRQEITFPSFWSRLFGKG
jgi:hypothetical protein